VVERRRRSAGRMVLAGRGGEWVENRGKESLLPPTTTTTLIWSTSALAEHIHLSFACESR
jgi:hypothetical protein